VSPPRHAHRTPAAALLLHAGVGGEASDATGRQDRRDARKHGRQPKDSDERYVGISHT
jgi:hypothetical protein